MSSSVANYMRGLPPLGLLEGVVAPASYTCGGCRASTRRGRAEGPATCTGLPSRWVLLSRACLLHWCAACAIWSPPLSQCAVQPVVVLPARIVHIEHSLPRPFISPFPCRGLPRISGFPRRGPFMPADSSHGPPREPGSSRRGPFTARYPCRPWPGSAGMNGFDAAGRRRTAHIGDSRPAGRSYRAISAGNGANAA